ncbi:MAG: molybdopterin-dependent oxidoreductase [Deltaproteobacteria bacterium]|nr:molybdopterin-dependent oxidoreductase [Deltaproteobacteria bacterium]MBW2362648.1 molybdopterin-dependent oxidoreductase [Deltaproteobacteria bacterium]
MLETKRSFCRICTGYCGISADVEDGRLLEVRGDPEHALSRGYSCIKGRRIPAAVNHPDRLRSCLAREDGRELLPIASERALDEIAARLTQLIERHGPRSVATYTGTGCWGNSALLEIEKAWHHGIGSVMRCSSATIDQQAKMIMPWFHGVWGGGPQSFETADVILLIGQNPLVSGQYQHGGPPYPTALQRARKRGLQLIVVDPRRTELARQADLHLQLIPGEDPTLLAAMLRVVLDEGLEDADFCTEHVRGLRELRAAVDDFTLEYAAQRCGVEREQIVTAARMFAAGPRGIASTGTGPSMAPYPNLSEHLVQSLNTVCGRWSREGERVNMPSVLTPALPRPAQALPPEFLPPDMSPTANAEMSRIRGLRQVYQEMPTAALADEILTPGEGQVRALIVVGGNPVLSWPDQKRTLRALAELELLVCLDIRLTPTCRRAHYVIASSHFAERADLTFLGDYFFEKPFSQYTEPLCERQGDVIDEADFFMGLARRMGTPIELPGGALDTEHPPDPLELFERVRPTPKVPIREIARYEGGHLFEEIDVRVAPAIPGVDARLDIAPAELMGELRAVRETPRPVPGSIGLRGDFTHLLISRRVKFMTNSVGQDLPRTAKELAYNPAYLHPSDLAALGFTSGDLVEIESEDGAIAAVVEPDEDLRSGVVSMAHCFGGDPAERTDPRKVGSPVAALIAVDHDYDPISGQARQSAIPVRLHKRHEVSP